MTTKENKKENINPEQLREKSDGKLKNEFKKGSGGSKQYPVIWNGDSLVQIMDGEWKEIATYKHLKVYFQVLRDKEGNYEGGWCDENGFDEVFGKLGYKREQFIELSIEDILKLL